MTGEKPFNVKRYCSSFMTVISFVYVLFLKFSTLEENRLRGSETLDLAHCLRGTPHRNQGGVTLEQNKEFVKKKTRYFFLKSISPSLSFWYTLSLSLCRHIGSE